MKNWRTTWWEKSNCVCVLIVEAEFDTIDNGTSQSQLVGIFQIIADRDAFGNGADDEIFFILHFFEDIIAGSISFDGGTEGKDDFPDRFLLYPSTKEVMCRSAGPIPSIGEMIPPSTWYKPLYCEVASIDKMSLMFSTTQSVVLSRFGSEQISQISPSEIL